MSDVTPISRIDPRRVVALPAHVDDELDFLAQQIDLERAVVLEVGCGNGAFGRRLAQRFPRLRYTGIEADRRQHARTAAHRDPSMTFLFGEGQALPLPDAGFDVVLMLKSLHHVPQAAMPAALGEAWRVLRHGGHLYVSEPVFDGPFNEVVRLFNDEQVVRAQAQQALTTAAGDGRWTELFDHSFQTPVVFADFGEFKRRLIDVTYEERRLSEELVARVRERFDAHMTAPGARFDRPMRARLLRKSTAR